MLGEALWEISATWAQTDQRATLACREVCMPVRPASQTAEMELEHLLKKSSAQKRRAAGRADGPGVGLPPLQGLNRHLLGGERAELSGYPKRAY